MNVRAERVFAGNAGGEQALPGEQLGERDRPEPLARLAQKPAPAQQRFSRFNGESVHDGLTPLLKFGDHEKHERLEKPVGAVPRTQPGMSESFSCVLCLSWFHQVFTVLASREEH